MQKITLSFFVVCFAVLAPCFSQEENILDKLHEIAIVDQKVMMPMSDGVRLATDIYRPKTDAPVPIIFSRTPYNFNSYRDGELATRTLETAYQAVLKGYAYVVQNERDPKCFEGGLYHDHMDFGVPSFWFVSWYDVSSSPNIALFNHVRENASDPEIRENQHLLISPTLHCGYTRATENTHSR